MHDLGEPEENTDECTEATLYNSNVKESTNQISTSNETENPTTYFVVQEVPSDNNSSFVNSEHDLQIVESELDSDMIDNEVNVNDASMAIKPSNASPINKSPECSNTKNVSVSQENYKSSQEEEQSLRNCAAEVPEKLQFIDTSCPFVENNAKKSSNVEMTDKNEAAKENCNFEVFPNEMHCQSTIDEYKKHDDCEANENLSVNTSHDNSSHEAAKSRDDFVPVNNSQYSTVISPPNQSNAVFSYTVPNLTVPNTSSDLSAQNNIQYQIVLNTPISWNVPIANGLSLVQPQGLSLVPSLSLSNVPQQVVFTPTKANAMPNPPLSNVPKHVAFDPISAVIPPPPPLPCTTKQADFASTTATNVISQVANFETVITDNHNEKAKSDCIVTSKWLFLSFFFFL